MKKELRILSIKEKVRVIKELQETYGDGMTLGDVYWLIEPDSRKKTIEECQFTGVNGRGRENEFTGTIKEIVVHQFNLKKEDLTDEAVVNWLIDVFTNGENWATYKHGWKSESVKCVPVDRIVNVAEVSEYLKELARVL